MLLPISLIARMLQTPILSNPSATSFKNVLNPDDIAFADFSKTSGGRVLYLGLPLSSYPSSTFISATSLTIPMNILRVRSNGHIIMLSHDIIGMMSSNPKLVSVARPFRNDPNAPPIRPPIAPRSPYFFSASPNSMQRPTNAPRTSVIPPISARMTPIAGMRAACGPDVSAYPMRPRATIATSNPPKISAILPKSSRVISLDALATMRVAASMPTRPAKQAIKMATWTACPFAKFATNAKIARIPVRAPRIRPVLPRSSMSICLVYLATLTMMRSIAARPTMHAVKIARSFSIVGLDSVIALVAHDNATMIPINPNSTTPTFAKLSHSTLFATLAATTANISDSVRPRTHSISVAKLLSASLPIAFMNTVIMPIMTSMPSKIVNMYPH